MKKVLKFLLESILNNPEKLEITEKEENGLVTLTLKLPSAEIGKVIGKKGRTIKALTDLIRIRAIKQEKRVILEVGE